MRRFVGLLILTLAVGGCRTARILNVLATEPVPAAVEDESDKTVSAQSPNEIEHAQNPVRTVSAQLATAVPAVGADESYAQAMRELETLGYEDPAARDQLWRQLQGVKPSLWPLAIQQFKSARAYHLELNKSAPAPATTPISYPPAPTVPAYESTAPAATTLPPQAAVKPAAEQPSIELSPPAPSLTAKPIEAVVAPSPAPSFQQLKQQVLQASFENAAVGEGAIPQAAPFAANTRDPLLGWRSSVDDAIAQLTETSSADPRTRHEAYQQARLRLLQLVAGNRDAAVSPVPGLTPTEQGYWSQQLLAMATLLDPAAASSATTNVSLAARHLQDASTQLGELADLHVLNLAFCAKVYGYGDYDAVPSTKFRAGQAVSLYVEIDNYRSELREGKYHTSVGTSYEILDAAGQRVDGGEFAVINDQCRNRRRDFYIEYSLNLPQRVYPGRYQLRLTVNDRLADKLGSQTIEFEVIEAAKSP